MHNAPRPAPISAASFEELKDKHELIGDVRGMGLMQAIELVEDRKYEERPPPPPRSP